MSSILLKFTTTTYSRTSSLRNFQTLKPICCCAILYPGKNTFSQSRSSSQIRSFNNQIRSFNPHVHHVKNLSYTLVNHVNKNDVNKNDENKDEKCVNDKNKVHNKKPVKSNDSRFVYYFKQVKFAGIVFMNGIRNLWYDVKLAVQTRRKIGLYDSRDYSNITREELRHMRQTKADVKKTIPVALLFMIPMVGYFAPVIALIYPRHLLSQHFWHPDQKDAFVLEEYEKRSQYYLPLIKEIALTCKESKCKELYKLCLKVITGNHPSNSELLYFKEVFSTNECFSLRSVPRYHLVKLCKCWLIPTGWFLPRWYLMKALRRRITRLHEDDMLILSEGVSSFPPASIGKAVHVRGMDDSVLTLTSQVYWLQEWVKISSKVSATDVSFLAHCAAFKAANFETHAKEKCIE